MKRRRYVRIDGEKRVWELNKCISEFSTLEEPAKKNLEFFIGLRNKIVHRFIDDNLLSNSIFGECQSMLHNYEDFVVKHFGSEYSLNTNLAFSLQFSKLRTPQQIEANRRLLTTEAQDIIGYIEKYRNSLSDVIFNHQSFSVKIFIVPRVSNTSRNDVAVDFIRVEDLDVES